MSLVAVATPLLVRPSRPSSPDCSSLIKPPAAAAAADVESLLQQLQASVATESISKSMGEKTQISDVPLLTIDHPLQTTTITAGQANAASQPLSAPVRSDGTRGQRAFWLLCAILSVAMGIYALQYWGLELFVPENIAANKYKTGWLVLHATAAACALFIGPAQFVPSLRRSRPTLHRYMGRAYAFACCTAGGAALPLAVGASTGPVSGVGFFLLGMSWILTTVLGVVQARRGLIPSHRRWMIRSFALALSALTLRMYIPIGIKITGGEFDPAYRVIAWVCWVPNLIAAEVYIRTAHE